MCRNACSFSKVGVACHRGDVAPPQLSHTTSCLPCSCFLPAEIPLCVRPGSQRQEDSQQEIPNLLLVGASGAHLVPSCVRLDSDRCGMLSLQEYRHYCRVLRAAGHPAGDHLSDGTLTPFLILKRFFVCVGASPERVIVVQVVNVTGNQDICFYNFLCAHPLGALRWVPLQVSAQLGAFI